MTRTLYFRVVLTFLAAVVAGMTIAVLLGMLFFEKELDETGQRDLLAAGREIVQVYGRTIPTEMDSFMASMAKLSSYDLDLYATNGSHQYYPYESGRLRQSDIRMEAVQFVRNGNVYLSTAQDSETLVGLPFPIGDDHLALFVSPSAKNETAILRLLGAILFIALAIGGLFVLLGAKYIVKPIKALTLATKKIANGEYDIALDANRKDELGTLARSFTEMTVGLRQLENMRKEFVSNVSHEIQSPLTSISGFAKALKDKRLVPEEEREQVLEIIIAESGRLSKLGDHLLKLASLESERHPLELEHYRLDEQLRQLVVTSEPQLFAKNIRIDLELPRGSCSISADRELLSQVWLNLLGNAVKFTPDGGRIWIRLQIDPGSGGYIVTIRDSGVGIASEHLGRIFERFYKGDASRSDGGNGLGLAIVHKIVSLHGGRVEMDSLVKQGTTVTVQLPRTFPNETKK
ncbi:sensor histidine kinase [Cohnella cholangitidis]|uniref:Heme sensor protein HssS n=1 Tax=Cohnella cholangitidis TaxID=2598458 RepID=A0A7G5BT46_9BACL|nr:HAMP domain-containing sensor histidine kinase [Cohnella cholangitidis]QMV40130.1 HAMP domain-containing protein [Cohnella cholangitidis]